MSERAMDALILIVLVVATIAVTNVWSISNGRCQSACWLAKYSYVSTDATACLCDNAGVPVAVAVPEAPHGR